MFNFAMINETYLISIKIWQMKKKVILMLLSLVMFTYLVNGQGEESSKTTTGTTKYKKAWAIGAFGGLPIVFGDVNPDFRSLGYGLNIQKAVSNSVSLRLHFSSGFACGVDRKFANQNMILDNPALNGINDSNVNFAFPGGYTYYNYKTQFYEGSLQLIYNLAASDFRQSESPKSNFYLFFGAGGMLHRTYTDQLDANGNLYDFSSIYNDYIGGVIEQNEAKKQVSALLDRNYETAADGNPLGTTRTFQSTFLNHTFVPEWTGGVGVRFKVSPRIDLSLEGKAVYSASDLYDGQRWDRITYGLSTNNDVLFMTMIGLNIRLGSMDNVYWFDNPATMHYKMTLDNKRKVTMLTQDNDVDGVPDYFDKDPNTPEGVKVDSQGLPLDSDADNIPDFQDSEPYSSKGVVVDEKGKSIDSDGDGVPDHQDLEENTEKGKLVNFQGITIGDRGSMSGVSGSAVGFLPAIFFDFDDATLKSDALSALSLVAAALKGNPNYKLRIIGYTDKVGSQEYNKILGERRAKAVADFLILQGINASRLEIISKGAADPLTDVSSRDANRLNRRVQFELVTDGKSTPKFEEVTPKTK